MGRIPRLRSGKADTSGGERRFEATMFCCERTVEREHHNGMKTFQGSERFLMGQEGQRQHRRLPSAEQRIRSTRAARVKVLDAIAICLQGKKPKWQKARIIHLATQLEESMFIARQSSAEYEDASTLPTRINRHCLLLATRKAAKPVAPHDDTLAPPPSVTGRRSQAMMADPRLPANSVQGMKAWDGARTRNPLYSGGITGQDEMYSSTETAVNAPDGVRRQAQGEDRNSPHLIDLVHDEMAPPSTLIMGQLEAGLTTMPATEQQQQQAAGDGLSSGDFASLRLVKDDYSLDALVVNSVAKARGKPGLAQASIRGLSVRHAKNIVARVVGDGDHHFDDAEQASLSYEGAPLVLEPKVDPESHGSKRAVHDEEVKQHALRLLQCRLLLLTHASKCVEEKGACRLAPLCDSVRDLLHHIHTCEDRSACEFPHCFSSKALLQHQHSCKDTSCLLCGSVRDLSQKCFWANARHAHKRRLQESVDYRRKKRQREGKTVARLRKPQVEKAKSAREVCAGLDEAGNDLGDISLGFFLRQDKAVKARKISQENASCSQPLATHQSVNGSPSLPRSRRHEQQGQQLRDATAAANSITTPPRAPAALGRAPVTPSSSCPSIRTRTNTDPVDTISLPGHDIGSPEPVDSSKALGDRNMAPTVVLPPKARLPAGSSKEYGPKSEVKASRAAEEVVSVTGFPEGRGVTSQSGRSISALPAGTASGAQLRSPSEMMLDEIALSLTDTTKRPSFARMQSLQAFLNDHGELRESASFEDVSALVGHWMTLEDTLGDDENLGMSSAFSF